MNSNVTLEEAAGLTDYQIRWLFFRDRDKYGRLIRSPALTGGIKDRRVPVHYADMQKDVWRNRGLSEDEVQRRWDERVSREPSLRFYLRLTGYGD